jgi:FecR protein
MRHTNTFRGPGSGLVALLFAALLIVALPSRAAAATGSDDILISRFSGDVQITSAGTDLPLRSGVSIVLPATVLTGANGSVDLQQGETKIAIGPGTRLDFPAQESAGTLERVSQPSGNAYYDVGARGGRRMRVETPYLVAVIRGTQFNVAVTPESSTVSLHEGRLEILATEDGIAPVLLNAGEVAVRRKDEHEIRVLKLGASAATGGLGGGGGSSPLAPDGNGPGDGDGPGSRGATAGADSDTGADFGDSGGSPLLATDDGTPIGAGVELGPAEAAATIDVGIDLGPESISADAGASIDLGAGGVDAGIDIGVVTGVVSADAAVDTGVDLGAGTVDAGVDIGADTGVISADADVDAGADLGSGTVDAGVDAAAGGMDAGVDIGVDLTGDDAGVNVGVDLLGTGIDLGLGGGGADPPDEPNPGSQGGILGGLFGGPRP